MRVICVQKAHTFFVINSVSTAKNKQKSHKYIFYYGSKVLKYILFIHFNNVIGVGETAQVNTMPPWALWF